ncbi:MAG: GntR family transcriptional regulator [bacterium]|nr:GntR family transcriptional regulator [bacterium]
MLRIDPSDAIPIWKQIEEGVQRLIATGTLGPNDPVASVRELARELRVNPLTVSKAYRRLADAGVLTVRRGEGTYVAPAPPRMAARERRAKLRDAARRYAGTAKTLSADDEESLAAVREALGELERPPEEGAE